MEWGLANSSYGVATVGAIVVALLHYYVGWGTKKTAGATTALVAIFLVNIYVIYKYEKDILHIAIDYVRSEIKDGPTKITDFKSVNDYLASRWPDAPAKAAIDEQNLRVLVASGMPAGQTLQVRVDSYDIGKQRRRFQTHFAVPGSRVLATKIDAVENYGIVITDRTILVIDLDDGEEIRKIDLNVAQDRIELDDAHDASVSVRDNMVALAFEDSVRVYKYYPGKWLRTFSDERLGRPNFVRIDSNGQSIMTGDSSGRMFIWFLDMARKPGIFDIEEAGRPASVVSPAAGRFHALYVGDRPRIVTVDVDGTEPNAVDLSADSDLSAFCAVDETAFMLLGTSRDVHDAHLFLFDDRGIKAHPRPLGQHLSIRGPVRPTQFDMACYSDQEFVTIGGADRTALQLLPVSTAAFLSEPLRANLF